MRLIDADKLMESLNPKESVWVGLVLSELIDNAPTVDAEPVRYGHWEHLYGGQYKCSNCGAWWGSEYADEITNDFYYCPNCGAKMDRKGEEDDGI